MSARLDGATQSALLTAAREARANAYVPYSRFPVGAAVLADDGSIVSGANVDNASYPLTMCAEQAAVAAAVRAGHRSLRAVAVIGPVEGVTPCGGCRQVFAEFATPDAVVLITTATGSETIPLTDLLPRRFQLGQP